MFLNVFQPFSHDWQEAQEADEESEVYESTSPIPGVYVLIFEGGRRLVGSSANISGSVRAHLSGKTLEYGFSARFQAVGFEYPATPAMEDLNTWELVETIEQAYNHGINRVRGHVWTNVILEEEERRAFFLSVCEAKGLCQTCGHRMYVKEECRATSKAAWAQDVAV